VSDAAAARGQLHHTPAKECKLYQLLLPTCLKHMHKVTALQEDIVQKLAQRGASSFLTVMQHLISKE